MQYIFIKLGEISKLKLDSMIGWELLMNGSKILLKHTQKTFLQKQTVQIQIPIMQMLSVKSIRPKRKNLKLSLKPDKNAS